MFQLSIRRHGRRCSRAVAVLLLSALLFGVSGCSSTGIPKGLTPVTGFDLDAYLGTWYEIARLDHRFERGLSDVTANYTMRTGGGVVVRNRGYAEKSGKFEEAEGKAFFVSDPDTAHLKVSFFGPFYGSYIVLNLDKENYQHAMIAGPNRNYLWILARDPNLSAETVESLIAEAAEYGFETEDLIRVEHTRAGLAQ